MGNTEREESRKSAKSKILVNDKNEISLPAMKLLSKKSKIKKYSCSYCEYTSKRERFLLRHLQKHKEQNLNDASSENFELKGDQKVVPEINKIGEKFKANDD